MTGGGAGIFSGIMWGWYLKLVLPAVYSEIKSTLQHGCAELINQPLTSGGRPVNNLGMPHTAGSIIHISSHGTGRTDIDTTSHERARSMNVY